MDVCIYAMHFLPLFLTNSFSEISANVVISYVLLKLDYLDYIFVADTMGQFFKPHLPNLPPQRCRRITQFNGHYAVQGRSTFQGHRFQYHSIAHMRRVEP